MDMKAMFSRSLTSQESLIMLMSTATKFKVIAVCQDEPRSRHVPSNFFVCCLPTTLAYYMDYLNARLGSI